MIKKWKTILILVGLVVSAEPPARGQSSLAQPYEFEVEHRHLLRNCQGILIIDGDQIEYQTRHTKDARAWRYEDIKRVEVISPTAIHIVTYEDQTKFLGADRRFEFRLLDGNITQEVNHFLLSRISRPLVTSLIPDVGAPPPFEFPVKHQHTFGGCEGVLKVYPEAIIYESQDPKHTRYWRYEDIQHIGQPGEFRFEITTFERQVGGPDRVFHFEMKRRLDDRTYDYIWVRVNQRTHP